MVIVNNMAYCGIEFYNENEENNGEIAVVHMKWLTPRKKEVLWPPYKMTSRFNKALTLGEEPNENCWQVYYVKRIFFECGMYYKMRYIKNMLHSRIIYIYVLYCRNYIVHVVFFLSEVILGYRY